MNYKEFQRHMQIAADEHQRIFGNHKRNQHRFIAFLNQTDDDPEAFTFFQLTSSLSWCDPQRSRFCRIWTFCENCNQQRYRLGLGYFLWGIRRMPHNKKLHCSIVKPKTAVDAETSTIKAFLKKAREQLKSTGIDFMAFEELSPCAELGKVWPHFNVISAEPLPNLPDLESEYSTQEEQSESMALISKYWCKPMSRGFLKDEYRKSEYNSVCRFLIREMGKIRLKEVLINGSFGLPRGWTKDLEYLFKSIELYNACKGIESVMGKKALALATISKFIERQKSLELPRIIKGLGVSTATYNNHLKNHRDMAVEVAGKVERKLAKQSDTQIEIQWSELPQVEHTILAMALKNPAIGREPLSRKLAADHGCEIKPGRIDKILRKHSLSNRIQRENYGYQVP